MGLAVEVSACDGGKRSSRSQNIVKHTKIFSPVADRYLESPMKGLCEENFTRCGHLESPMKGGSLRRAHFIDRHLESPLNGAPSDDFQTPTEIWRAP